MNIVHNFVKWSTLVNKKFVSLRALIPDNPGREMKIFFKENLTVL